MRLYEFTESVSVDSAGRDIVDGCVTRLAGMHSNIRKMLQRAYDNNGGELAPKAIRLMVGGQKSKIKFDEYDTVMKSALYELLKSTKDVALKKFLSDSINEQYNLGMIERILPDILSNIATRQHNKKLEHAVRVWKSEINKTDQFIDGLDDGEISDDPPAVKKPKEQNSISTQNRSVENIVNDVLSRLDKTVAGDIRNAISKSGNKLQALQQELTRRNIKI